MTTQRKTISASFIIFSCLTIVFFCVTLCLNFSVHTEQQFSFLAKSFLEGKTYFLENPGGNWTDTTLFKQRHYFPPGPFPAILLMPFVYFFGLFGGFFYQGYLQPFLVIGIFFIVWKISKNYKFNNTQSLILAFAFCFSSVFLGVAMLPWRSFFAHVITVFLLLLSILEYQQKNRLWLIGIIFALVTATRFTATVSVVFYILQTLTNNSLDFNSKLKNIVQLFLPIVLAVLILLIYNFMNYGNLFENGYSAQIAYISQFDIARKLGLYNLYHLPTNIYYSFISLPQVIHWDNTYVLKFPYLKGDPFGMSIFLTSPYLLYIITTKKWTNISKNLLIASVITSIPILLSYSTGFRQLGYRFFLDFFPFLFILFILTLKERTIVIPNIIKTLIFISCFTNLFFFFTIFFKF